jgi:hypothetical protein
MDEFSTMDGGDRRRSNAAPHLAQRLELLKGNRLMTV